MSAPENIQDYLEAVRSSCRTLTEKSPVKVSELLLEIQNAQVV